MRKFRFAFNILAITVFSLAISSVAQAQATRTWVSGVGDDANPCSRTAPCKTFAGAISKTAPCGEISVLDPGGFGAVTITKAITIDGDGTLAGILSANVNAIIVNAGAADVVIIRGISINGACSGIDAIKLFGAKHLHVENCTIYDFPSASSFGIEGVNAAASEISVVNTSFTNVNIGIRVGNVAGNSASISNCRIQRGTFGVDVLGGNATVSNSVISHQTTDGLVAENAGTLNSVGNVVVNNGIGINAFSSGSIINIANSDVLNNSTGVQVAAGGVCTRFQNNRIFQNTSAQITGTCNPQGNQ
jgi:Right handed beta helix region